MSKETYLQRPIKEKIIKKHNGDSGREYYWVKPIQDEVYNYRPRIRNPKGIRRMLKVLIFLSIYLVF
jgi:hypothetical protein